MSSDQKTTIPPKEKIRDIQQKARTLTDDVSELFELYYRLAVVTTTEKASTAISASLTAILILFLLMFTLLFAGFGIGWFLGEKLNSMLAGYLIVAGMFALLITLAIVFRKTILFPFIRDSIIKKVYE